MSTDGAVVLLTSSDRARKTFGTGFVFHRDLSGCAFVLTCLHVVEDLTKGVEGSDGDGPKVLADGLPAEVWARGDDPLDLAVLAVDGLAVEPLPLGPRAEPGRTVVTPGFSWNDPKRGDVVFEPLDGRVRKRRPLRSVLRPWIIGVDALDLGIDPDTLDQELDGYSGSPVLDARTRHVVGVMNLQLSKDKAQALCIGSCEMFDPPLSERLPDYAPPPADAPAHAALGWLASTLDHEAPLAAFEDGLAAAVGGVGFFSFEACEADCPHALAEHLAVACGGPHWQASAASTLVTEPRLHRWDAHALWKALLAAIPPGTPAADRAEEAERLVGWINDAGPARRVVYCRIPLAEQGRRASDFIRGAMDDFGTLSGIRREAGLLLLFGYIYRDAGLWWILDRRHRPRIPGCCALGPLGRLRQSHLTTWLRHMEHPLPGSPRLAHDTLNALRGALEPLFPNDAVCLRYRTIRHPALKVLAQAAPIDP